MYKIDQTSCFLKREECTLPPLFLEFSISMRNTLRLQSRSTSRTLAPVKSRLDLTENVRWSESGPEPKPCAIAQENGQTWQNSRVLSTSELPCTGGHGALKSSPERKTMCYSPWKRPEMTKFTSFVDFQITVYRGSRAVEIVSRAKTVCYSPWKRPEMMKFTSIVHFQITVYRGSRGVQIVPGMKNRVL